ncbi:hypothetical protein HMPREF2534_03738 [Bacteroides thetaiotaomicron]|nr:hypothetical protein HMPREF2534_03738 [Bacteroides thetaiotaomicron]
MIPALLLAVLIISSCSFEEVFFYSAIDDLVYKYFAYLSE